MNIAWVFLTTSLQLVPAPAADIPACGVELHMRAKTAVMEVEHQQIDPWTAFEVELVNSSDRTVTLVMPGDGSDVAWRTPVMRWSVSPELLPLRLARCGNINPLHPDEVFTLAPGERRRLNRWVPPLYGVQSGTYTLRLTYINDPKQPWKGVSLGPHEPAAMARVRESTPCRAVSNDVELTVVAKTR